MHTPLIPVIMSGGSGSRLWPLSREKYPKPFAVLPKIGSLIEQTYNRVSQLHHVQRVITVTNKDFLALATQAYAGDKHLCPENVFLLEPFGRDTAAAIALALAHTLASDTEAATLLILPADHLIDNLHIFSQAVERAHLLATQGHIVTFGIKPDRPETGFGYLETQEERVLRFVEKPDAKTAATYMASSHYYWNSGMFCFSAKTMLDAMQEYCPHIFSLAQSAFAHAPKRCLGEQTIFDIAEDPFSQISPLSIDYAVMEKSENIACVPLACGWSDVGSWTAVSQLLEADSDGNRTTGEPLLEECKNCFVHSEEDRVVSMIGVSDICVVDTADALLITHKDKTQSVKTTYNRLKDSGHEAAHLHRTVHRPWGTYTILDQGERFKVKRIVVHPEQTLSLQAHRHRSEHWVVVAGTALVTNGDEETLLAPNQSIYIPCGHKHRLKNLGVLPLILIEVQTGEYLGEDDIIRFEDVYGRV